MAEATVFDEIVGKTLKKAFTEDNYNDALYLVADDGTTFRFMHNQSCCEYVYIEDIEGDLSDLVGSPILQAEVVEEDNPDVDCGMWTFYKFATLKGYVTIRFYGTSNGYYGVSVNMQIFHESAAED